MSNETGNQSSNTQEDTTPPWERVWNDVKVAVSDAVEPIQKAVKQPWEQFWGGDKGSAQATPPTPVRKAPDRFENVFNRLINTESAGRHTTASGTLTTSVAGAKGLTQVMSKTGAKPGFGVLPIQNDSEAEYKRFGRDYLKAMLNEFNGDYEKAVAAYNAGAGSVKRAITKGGEDWKQFLPKKSETLPYLNKILGSTTSNEGAGQQDQERIVNEALPKIQFNALVKAGLDTVKGRERWGSKIEAEYEKSKAGKSKKELDKYYSNSYYYAKDKYPTEIEAYRHLTAENLPDVPVSVSSFLEQQNPNITFTNRLSENKGFVYADKGERVFVDAHGDYTTMVHESEHLRQQADYASQGQDAPHAKLAQVGSFDRPANQLMRLSESMKDDPAFKAVWRASNSYDSRGEWLANLVGFMKTGIPEGKGWSDIPMFQTLIKKVGKEQATTMLLDAILTTQHKPKEK